MHTPPPPPPWNGRSPIKILPYISRSTRSNFATTMWIAPLLRITTHSLLFWLACLLQPSNPDNQLVWWPLSPSLSHSDLTLFFSKQSFASTFPLTSFFFTYIFIEMLPMLLVYQNRQFGSRKIMEIVILGKSMSYIFISPMPNCGGAKSVSELLLGDDRWIRQLTFYYCYKNLNNWDRSSRKMENRLNNIKQ